MIINSNLFLGKQFVLDLNYAVSSKRKNELRDKITKYGGVISYIVSKKSNYVVVASAPDQEENVGSFKIATARKYNLPVVKEDFIDACLECGCLLNHEEYEITETKEKEEEKATWLNEGKISFSAIEANTASKAIFSKKSARVWRYKDESGPNFHENDYKIIKVHFYKGKKKSLGDPFCVLELHVLRELTIQDAEFRFCVFSHHGYLPLTNKHHETKECRYFTSATDALGSYVQLWRQLTNPPQSMQKVIRLTSVNSELGSDQLKLDQWINTKPLTDNRVLSMVQLIWTEAERELDQTLEAHWKTITFDKVEEAIGILLTIERKTFPIEKTSSEFFELIPLKQRVNLEERRNLIDAFNLCQLIKDSIRVSEMTSGRDVSVDLKYNALRCRIEHVSSHEDDHQDICRRMAGADVIVKNIFRVSRDNEDDDFLSDVGNDKLLFHATNTRNIVGILSRGLLIPRSKQPVTSLGAGIYFADNVSAIKDLITPNFTRKTRLLLVHEVALGNCHEVCEKNPHLQQPPDDCNSVHGVSKGEGSFSEFEFDEYVIYDRRQQRIRYLVEFYLPGEEVNFQEETAKESKTKTAQDDEVEITDESTHAALIDTDELLHLTKPITPQSKIGLQSVRGDSSVELKGVSVHGRLFDLTAEVVILQEYMNNSSTTIEAKYVFPVDEMAAVCGFEAFLNGRHVIGRVEEKQTARQQYQEAVSRGKSALLMDQATPDVFTITIGNILPNSSVIVKITYVTELDLEDDLISFRLPGSVSPSQPESSSSTVTSSEVKTFLELSLVMPYDIRLITSSTHRIRVKKTASMATVQLVNGQLLNERGFQLLVGLAEIHCPRMLTEDAEKGTEACMLTFYPEFSCKNENENQVILVLDSSNSMIEGNAFLTAQKVALICLQKLPSQCSFNVISFGSTYEDFYPDCMPYSLETVHEASKFISKQKPSKGDSAIRKLFESIFLLSQRGVMKNIILISDGYLNDDYDALLSTVRNNCNEKGLTRIFTLAVGQAPNRHLMRGLARIGAGTFALFQDYSECWAWTERIEKVMAQTQAPAVADISVEWQIFDETGCPPLVQAPRSITTLFNGSRLVVYGLLAGASTLMAELKARIPGGCQVKTVVSPYNSSTSRGKIIHRLATRAVVRDWEHGSLNADRAEHEVMKKTLKNELIQLSKFYSIVTPFTSFIAIDDENEGASEFEISFDYLVSRESVDQLSYLEYDDVKQQGDKCDDKTVVEEIMKKDIEVCVKSTLLSEELITTGTVRPLTCKRMAKRNSVFRPAKLLADSVVDSSHSGFIVGDSSPTVTQISSTTSNSGFRYPPSILERKLDNSRVPSAVSFGAASAIPAGAKGPFSFGAASAVPTGANRPFSFGAATAVSTRENHPFSFAGIISDSTAVTNSFGFRAAVHTAPKLSPRPVLFGNAPAGLFAPSAPPAPPAPSAPPAFPTLPSASYTPDSLERPIAASCNVNSSEALRLMFERDLQQAAMYSELLDKSDSLPSVQTEENEMLSTAKCENEYDCLISAPYEPEASADLDSGFRCIRNELNDYEESGECFREREITACRSQLWQSESCEEIVLTAKKKKKQKCARRWLSDKRTEYVYLGAWVELNDSCVSFGDGLPFCFTFYKASFIRTGEDFIPPSRLRKILFGDAHSDCHVKCLDENTYQSFTNRFNEQDWNKQLWDAIVEELRIKGLNSLPRSSVIAVYRIISVLGLIFKVIQTVSVQCLPLRLSNLTEIQNAVDEFAEALANYYSTSEITDKVSRAVSGLVYYNHQHPMLYRTLQLGNCWEEAFQRLTQGKSLILQDL